MILREIYADRERRRLFLGRDPHKGEVIIDTNQYLVLHRGKGLLLDPGGAEVFPSMAAALSRVLPFEDLEAIFASHQDPDIVYSLALWLDLCPKLEVYVSWLWGGFIPHFGGGRAVTALPDEGGKLPLGGSHELELVPAHYLHSSGNFHVYDPRAKILFSGDIGAALLPPDRQDVFVRDFDAHVEYMAGFHRRWLPSNRAKQAWLERGRKLDVAYLCPQHGAIFRGEDVGRFLDWLEGIEVGVAV